MAKQRQSKYVIFLANNKEFCWRFIKNGREIFRSSETYKRKASVKRSILIALNSGADAEIFDETIKVKK